MGSGSDDIVLLFVKTRHMTARAAAVPIWMFGSGHGEDGGVLTVDLSSAVAWMRWDLFFGFQPSRRR